jgi:hypothetical protein
MESNTTVEATAFSSSHPIYESLSRVPTTIIFYSKGNFRARVVQMRRA